MSALVVKDAGVQSALCLGAIAWRTRPRREGGRSAPARQAHEEVEVHTARPARPVLVAAPQLHQARCARTRSPRQRGRGRRGEDVEARTLSLPSAPRATPLPASATHAALHCVRQRRSRADALVVAGRGGERRRRRRARVRWARFDDATAAPPRARRTAAGYRGGACGTVVASREAQSRRSKHLFCLAGRA